MATNNNSKCKKTFRKTDSLLMKGRTLRNKMRKQAKHAKLHPNDLGKVRVKDPNAPKMVRCYVCGKLITEMSAVFELIDGEAYVFCKDHVKPTWVDTRNRLHIPKDFAHSLPKAHSEARILLKKETAELKAQAVNLKNAADRVAAQDRQVYSEVCGAMQNGEQV